MADTVQSDSTTSSCNRLHSVCRHVKSMSRRCLSQLMYALARWQIDLARWHWTRQREKIDLEQGATHAEEEVQPGADNCHVAPDRGATRPRQEHRACLQGRRHLRTGCSKHRQFTRMHANAIAVPLKGNFDKKSVIHIKPWFATKRTPYAPSNGSLVVA